MGHLNGQDNLVVCVGNYHCGFHCKLGDETVDPLVNKSSHTYAVGSEAIVIVDGQFAMWNMRVAILSLS